MNQAKRKRMKRSTSSPVYYYPLSMHDCDLIERSGHIYGLLELTHYLDDVPFGLNVISPVARIRCHKGSGSVFEASTFRPIRAS